MISVPLEMKVDGKLRILAQGIHEAGLGQGARLAVCGPNGAFLTP